MAEGGGHGNPGVPNLTGITISIPKEILAIENGLCEELLEKVCIDYVFKNTKVAWVYNPRYHHKTSICSGCMRVENCRITYSDDADAVDNRLKPDAHMNFLKRFEGDGDRVLLLGMDPGSKAEEQNGIAFADDRYPTSWLMGKLPSRKFKMWVENRTTADGHSGAVFVKALALNELFGIEGGPFFTKKFFVYNYCPVSFQDVEHTILPLESMNRTFQKVMEQPCDASLKKMVECLKIKHVVAFGNYTQKRAEQIRDDGCDIKVTYVPHPGAHDDLATKIEEIKDGMHMVMLSLIRDEVMRIDRTRTSTEEDKQELAELRVAIHEDGEGLVRSVWLRVNKLANRGQGQANDEQLQGNPMRETVHKMVMPWIAQVKLKLLVARMLKLQGLNITMGYNTLKPVKTRITDMKKDIHELLPLMLVITDGDVLAEEITGLEVADEPISSEERRRRRLSFLGQLGLQQQKDPKDRAYLLGEMMKILIAYGKEDVVRLLKQLTTTETGYPFDTAELAKESDTLFEKRTSSGKSNTQAYIKCNNDYRTVTHKLMKLSFWHKAVDEIIVMVANTLRANLHRVFASSSSKPSSKPQLQAPAPAASLLAPLPLNEATDHK